MGICFAAKRELGFSGARLGREVVLLLGGCCAGRAALSLGLGYGGEDDARLACRGVGENEIFLSAPRSF